MNKVPKNNLVFSGGEEYEVPKKQKKDGNTLQISSKKFLFQKKQYITILDIGLSAFHLINNNKIVSYSNDEISSMLDFRFGKSFYFIGD